jgi:putative glutamine amidotransferase
MARNPVIGITFSSYIAERQRKAYLDSLGAAGFAIRQVYPAAEGLHPQHAVLDGLVLAGGGDVNPSLYGEADRYCRLVDDERDRLELELFQWARGEGVPVLGVCRGIQALNIFMGGSLYQDLAAQKEPPLVPHSTPLADAGYRHCVHVEQGSRLARRTAGTGRIWVNSHHHQAVRRVADGLQAVGRTEDMVVEAVEAAGEPIFGVQWHPELMGLEGQRLFEWFRGICQGEVGRY